MSTALEEAKALKYNLEVEISRLLTKFTEETGLTIEGLDLTTMRVHAMSDEFKPCSYTVLLDIRIH